MFFVLFILLCFLAPLSTYSQETVLHFSWDVSVTEPDIAPPGVVASTTSPYVTIAAGGVGGTNGLSAGLRAGGNSGVTSDKANIQLVVPAHEAFNVQGIDISLDYQRDESAGTLVSRGTNFAFGTAEGAQVTYSLVDPATNAVTAYTSPVYPLDLEDNLFHTLRFVYDPNTGQAQLSIDGTVVWDPGVTTPGQLLVWEETADILIGEDIDGAGFDRAILDNFSLANVALQTLPVDLTAFTAEPDARGIRLEWETAREWNHAGFAVQRRLPGGTWTTLKQLAAEQHSSGRRYTYLDEQPAPGINYYRLAQIDLSGGATYSAVRSAWFSNDHQAEVPAYPNPTTGLLTVSDHAPDGYFRISDLRGTDVTDRITVDQISTVHQLDLRALPAGWYVVRTRAGSQKVRKR